MPAPVVSWPGRDTTEAAVDLCRLAGVPPVAAICEIVNDDGSMARELDLIAFADRHDLMTVTIRELIHRLGLSLG